MNAALLIAGLGLFVLLSAGLTICGYYLRPRRILLAYIFKPLAILAILATALLPGINFDHPYHILLATGLFFSFWGDIALLLPHDRFRHGLFFFLLAQLWYILAFAAEGLTPNILLPLVLLSPTGVVMLRYLWPGLSSSLRKPVAAYMAVIIITTASAISRTMDNPAAYTLLAAIGILLFLASDAMLAANRFRTPFPLGRAFVLSAYFVGQWLIALSAALRGSSG